MKPKSPFDNLNKLANKAVENGWFKGGEKSKIEEKRSEKLSIKEACEIIGDENFYGPMEIFKTLGISVENMTIPEIQFSKSELEQAKWLGQELILYLDKDQEGNPLTVARIKNLCTKREKLVASSWLEGDSVAGLETPRLGWRLSEKEPLTASANRDYIGQTEEIINHLTDVVFRDHIPLEFEEAIAEFDLTKGALDASAKSNDANEWRPVGEKLANLKINQLCRENFTEAIYRLALHEKKTGERLLDPNGRDIYHTWTNSYTLNGYLVRVGDFSSLGTIVDERDLKSSRSDTGVCFSRS